MFNFALLGLSSCAKTPGRQLWKPLPYDLQGEYVIEKEALSLHTKSKVNNES